MQFHTSFVSFWNHCRLFVVCEKSWKMLAETDDADDDDSDCCAENDFFCGCHAAEFAFLVDQKFKTVSSTQLECYSCDKNKFKLQPLTGHKFVIVESYFGVMLKLYSSVFGKSC